MDADMENPSQAVKLLKEWIKCRQPSLSVSDRIEVNNKTIECASQGWKEVAPSNPQLEAAKNKLQEGLTPKPEIQ
jgi:hypothetical protein